MATYEVTDSHDGSVYNIDTDNPNNIQGYLDEIRKQRGINTNTNMAAVPDQGAGKFASAPIANATSTQAELPTNQNLPDQGAGKFASPYINGQPQPNTPQDQTIPNQGAGKFAVPALANAKSSVLPQDIENPHNGLISEPAIRTFYKDMPVFRHFVSQTPESVQFQGEHPIASPILQSTGRLTPSAALAALSGGLGAGTLATTGLTATGGGLASLADQYMDKNASKRPDDIINKTALDSAIAGLLPITGGTSANVIKSIAGSPAGKYVAQGAAMGLGYHGLDMISGSIHNLLNALRGK